MTSEASDVKRCPYCAEEILAAAVRCKHCHAEIPAQVSVAARSDSDDTVAILALLVPAIGAGFVWLWIGQLTAADDPSGKLLWVTVAVVTVSAGLVAIDAARARTDRLNSPWPVWLIGMLTFWALAFPAWFRARSRSGMTNFFGLSVVSMLVYVGAPVGLVIRAELASRAANRVAVEQANAINRMRPSHDDEERSMRREFARYEHDRDAVRAERPKTEDEVVGLMGRRPDNIVETSEFTILQWYYDSKPVGRDVIQIIMQNGRVSASSF